MIPVEGSRVSYIGPEDNGLRIGDSAEVLSAGAHSSHIVFRTGAKTNEIMFMPNHDFVQPTHQAVGAWDDSLEGPILATSTIRAFEQGGPKKVVAVLQQEGHLNCLDRVRDETFDFILARLKSDASLQAVIAELGDDDGEAVVMHTARVLMRDLLGEI